MSILEALTHGIPVVTTPVGGIPDVIEPGKNGFLVNPGDTTALTECLYKAVSDPENYNRMSEYALYHMRKEFSMEYAKKRLANIYDSLR